MRRSETGDPVNAGAVLPFVPPLNWLCQPRLVEPFYRSERCCGESRPDSVLHLKGDIIFGESARLAAKRGESSMPTNGIGLKVCALGAILVLAGCAGEPRRSGPISQKTLQAVANARVDPAAATRMLTAYRTGHGLGPVRLDPTLTAMAQRQADAMARAGSLSHDVGGNFSSRINAAGLDTVRAGENLGGGYFSTEEAFDGWQKSSGHKANLLMPQATRFGIALAKDPTTEYRVYWAMVVAAEPEKRSEGPGVLMSPLGPVISGSGRAASSLR